MKKIIAMILVLVLCLSMVSVIALAEAVPTTTAATTQEENESSAEQYTLTVKVPDNWTKVCAFTWDLESLGEYPGSVMEKKSDNTFECAIRGDVKNLVISNQDSMRTNDLVIKSGCDVKIVISADAMATITYPGEEDSGGRRPAPLDPEGELSEYRVVGNTDWLGNWDAAFEGGRMYKVAEGVYRKNFQDVPPGSYAIRITKGGKWDGAYGYNGQNYCFTVGRQGTITVDLDLRGDEAVIDVYGQQAGWWEDDEDENPETSDLAVAFPAALLLVSVVTLPTVLRKKEFME